MPARNTENLVASTRYGDLYGEFMADGHGAGPLEDIAKAAGVNTVEYLPVSARVSFGVDPEIGPIARFTFLAIDRSNQGEGLDQVLALANANAGKLYTVRVEGPKSVPVSTLIYGLLKRVNLVVKTRGLEGTEIIDAANPESS